MQIAISAPPLALIFLFSLTAPLPIHGQQTKTATPVNADAKTLADFTMRVGAYAKLRDGLAKETPPLKKTEEPAEIAHAVSSLAAEVRRARATATHGDIFTPDAQRLFRRLLRPSVKGPDGAENSQAIKEDSPDPQKLPYKVNADYPKDVALSTVPPDVLASLPALPKDLNYRFAGKHLILHDTRANVIVDFVFNALP